MGGDHPTGDWIPYEVGPLARMMANSSLINGSVVGGGGPFSPAQAVTAVNAGKVGLYYPGVLRDVDMVLSPNSTAVGAVNGYGIGVMPGRAGAGNLSGSDVSNPLGGLGSGENLGDHLTWAGVNLAGTLVTGLPGLNATLNPVFYMAGGVNLAGLVNFHGDYMGGATLDRIAARTLETYYVGMQMLDWFNEIESGDPTCVTKKFNAAGTQCSPKWKARGAGLTEAPRGAVAHWISIGKGRSSPRYKKFKGKVSNYQIITPTAWNISPKDHNTSEGPMEKCTLGTPLVSDKEPIEILRVIHSFDPCCACTVHLMNAKKEKVSETTLEALI